MLVQQAAARMSVFLIIYATTKTRNPSGNILYNHVRHIQNNDVLAET